MKKFDQLTKPQQEKVLERFFFKNVQKAYRGGLKLTPENKADLDKLVKETEEKYFSDGGFCGCTTCLEYVTAVVKASTYGGFKEAILSATQKDAADAFYPSPDDVIEIV